MTLDLSPHSRAGTATSGMLPGQSDKTVEGSSLTEELGQDLYGPQGGASEPGQQEVAAAAAPGRDDQSWLTRALNIGLHVLAVLAVILLITVAIALVGLLLYGVYVKLYM